MSQPPVFRKHITFVWFFFLACCVAIVLIFPEQFKPARIAAFIEQFKGTMLFVYFIFSILRGLTLIPSTPLVLAGTILLPEEPFLILVISLAGIIFSSTMIYYFSDYLGFGHYLEKKHPERICQIKNHLQKPTGFFFVFFWSFFPALPTDAVCYVAGILRMNYRKFILATTFGELIICSVYIFFYTSVLKPIFG